MMTPEEKEMWSKAEALADHQKKIFEDRRALGQLIGQIAAIKAPACYHPEGQRTSRDALGLLEKVIKFIMTRKEEITPESFPMPPQPEYNEANRSAPENTIDTGDISH